MQADKPLGSKGGPSSIDWEPTVRMRQLIGPDGVPRLQQQWVKSTPIYAKTLFRDAVRFEREYEWRDIPLHFVGEGEG